MCKPFYVDKTKVESENSNMPDVKIVVGEHEFVTGKKMIVFNVVKIGKPRKKKNEWNKTFPINFNIK